MSKFKVGDRVSNGSDFFHIIANPDFKVFGTSSPASPAVKYTDGGWDYEMQLTLVVPVKHVTLTLGESKLRGTLTGSTFTPDGSGAGFEVGREWNIEEDPEPFKLPNKQYAVYLDDDGLFLRVDGTWHLVSDDSTADNDEEFEGWISGNPKVLFEGVDD